MSENNVIVLDIEDYNFGIIDKAGNLYILVGTSLVKVMCSRFDPRVDGRLVGYGCAFNCSHFSGNLKFSDDGVTCYDCTIKLLCSGRTLHFKKLVAYLGLGDVDIDVDNMNAMDILKALQR